MDTKHLLCLAETYAAHCDVGLFSVADRAGVHDRTFTRLKHGAGCRVDTFAKALGWFDANWPADLDWPASVNRPSQRGRKRRAA